MTSAQRPGWREIDWPAHVCRESIAGGLSYVDLGGGDSPPLVFIHGLGGSWQNWLETLPAVARARRAIAVDLPGFGRSGPVRGQDASIPGYAAVVDELCERLELDEVVLVGNSMGGFIAAELALRNPQRARGLVLVSAAGMTPSQAELWRAVAQLSAGGAVRRVAHGFADTIAARPGLRRAALRLVAHEPERLAADLVRESLSGPPPTAFYAALRATVSYLGDAWMERAGSISCPTLVIWGEHDALIPVRHCDEWSRCIAGAEALVLPGTGHLPMLERPEEFNRALLAFIG